MLAPRGPGAPRRGTNPNPSPNPNQVSELVVTHEEHGAHLVRVGVRVGVRVRVRVRVGVRVRVIGF